MGPDDSAPPIGYSVRTSARARYARLVVSPREGVVVVVPRRFDPDRIPEIVARKAEWIRRAERRIAREMATVGATGAADATGRPEAVELRALGEVWAVRYGAPGARTGVREADATLWVAAPDQDAYLVLGRWLTTRARAELVPWLARLAAQHEVEVTGTSVRAQRSRWASCSSAGRVSINRNLLFLPPELVQHVLLHELCHRLEMSHSPRFWRLLATFDADVARHRREMTSSWKYVPRWVQR